MSRRRDRRDFLKQSALAGAGFWAAAGAAPAESRSANEKLNVALIGCGGRGASNLSGVKKENIVALCDVDGRRAKGAFEAYDRAAKYQDFRVMLDKQKDIQAVVVSTPDHLHAPATLAALNCGKPVYCEKPLTHTVGEARRVIETANRLGLPTQMGTQIHAGENYRRVVEIVQAGVLGPIRECHVWVGKNWGGGERPKETPVVPAEVNWDLWLGPAAYRPYHSIYMPKNWRRWWDFGTGTLGDMACHYMDLPFWALKLRHPTRVESQGAAVHPETCPVGLTVRYEFPEREGFPALKLIWRDGNQIPKKLFGQKVPGSGVMFIGERGRMLAGYSSYKLLPESEFEGFKPPEKTIERSVGHHQEWINACKTGSATTCNFDYSGTLTEAVLLGDVAYRVGQPLKWNAKKLTADDCPQADKFINKTYRNGWALG